MVRSHSIPGRAQSRRIAVSALALALTVALGHAHSQPGVPVTAAPVGPVTGHAPVVVIESVANRTAPTQAPAVGHALRATASATDADDDTITTMTYRWKRNGVEVGTGLDYATTAADAGQTLTLEVEASTDPAITEPYRGVASTTVAVGTNSPPDIVDVTIAGTWAIGQTLTADFKLVDADGDLIDEAGMQYQWFIDDGSAQRAPVAVPGATGRTFVLRAQDAGVDRIVWFSVEKAKTLTGVPNERLRPTSPAGAWQQTRRGTIAGNAPVANPSITGTVAQGQTLTGVVNYSDAENDPQGTHGYQWYRATDAAGTNRTPISGATNITYAIQAADNGHYLVFEVIPRSASGEPAEGVAARAVTAGSVPMTEDVPVAYEPGYSGLLQPGDTLTSDFKYRNVPGGPGPGTHTYQWFTATSRTGAGKTDIAGANGVTYTLTPADSGRYVGFRVTPRSTAGGTGLPVEYMRPAEVVYRNVGPWFLNSNSTRTIPVSVGNRTGNAPSDLSVRFGRGCHWLIQDGWKQIESVTLVAPDGTRYPLGSGGEPCEGGSWRVNASGKTGNGTWNFEFRHNHAQPIKIADIDWVSLGFDEP